MFSLIHVKKKIQPTPFGRPLGGAVLFFLFLFFLYPSLTVRAASEKRVFTIESAIERAVLVSPLAKEAEYKAERAGLDVKKFKMEKYFPKIKIRLMSGLVPEAKGTVLSSEDDMNDLDGLAPFYKVDIEAFKPLYTFGVLEAAVNAATEGARFERAKRDLLIEGIWVNVVKAYWAFYNASKAETLASELKKRFEEILIEVKNRLEDENSGVGDSDYLKLKTSSFKIHEAYQKSLEAKKISRLFLYRLLDLSPDQEYEFSLERTPSFALTNEEKGRSYEVSRDSSLLIEGVSAAVKGLKSKLEVSKRQRYPVIFLGAKFRYAQADNRTDQSNPFVVDDFNYTEIGAALGVEWKPDFASKSTGVKKSRLDYFAAIQKRKAVEVKVELDLKQALFRVEKNKALMEASRRSLKAAKSWLRISGDNWEMGIGELNQLIDAYKAYYELRGVEIDIANKYNASLADLAFASGSMKLYLKWLKEGRVSYD